MAYRYAVWCGFAALLSVAVWFFFLQESEVEEHRFSSVKKVDVLQLKSPFSNFSRQTILRDEPLVIKNSVTSLWNARKLWSPAYLQRNIGTLSGIYSNDNRWFGPYYDTTKPLTSVSHRLNRYSTDTVMSAKKFFQRIQNPKQGQYLYYSAEIDRLGEWAVDDIQPLNELLSPNPQRSSINVWMGQPRVIAHCHYDGYYNFYAQLYGTKQFTMFRPTNWPGLYPYPFLHPSHAQAQVNLSDLSNAGTYPLTSRVEAYSVILQPGDLLYMPPMWFHHVESKSVSISVNVWTDSYQTSVMEEVFALTIPTGSNWSSDYVQAVAGSVVMNKVVMAVCRHHKNCVRPFNDRFASSDLPTDLNRNNYVVYKLWAVRYKILMEKGEQASQYISTGDRSSLLCEDNTQLSSEHSQELTSWLERTDFNGYIQSLEHLFAKLPADTWEMWLGNYLEYMAASLVELQYVGMFLKHFDTCIHNDKALFSEYIVTCSNFHPGCV